MSVIVEGARSFHLGAQAWLVEDDRELAWAEKHVVKNQALKYVLGRYVEANNVNSNGHIFDLTELGDAQKLIPNTPLNLLHRPHYIVGNYIAAELVYPTEVASDGGGVANPYVEALAAFYRYYFPEEFAVVEKAHKDGALYYSMECVPQTVTCVAVCGKQYAYDGRQSPTYCAHMNEPGAQKKLGVPQFTGGALIIPPVKPGWKRADITEISALLAKADAESTYEQVKKELPSLNAAQWEYTVAKLMMMAHEDVEGEHARIYTVEQRNKFALSGIAMPNGDFPIVDDEDLANAIESIGRANPVDRSKVKAHIKKRASALKSTSKIPASW